MKYLLLVIFMLPFSSFGKILEVRDFRLIKEECVNSQKDNLLVIFDIDYVLMMPKVEYSLSRNKARRKIWKRIKGSLKEEDADFLRSIIVSNSKWELMDKNIFDIFEFLKKNNNLIVGLTALCTGKLGVIEKREDLRRKELLSLGIDFLKFNTIKDNFKIEYLENYYGIPMIKDGVIYTSELDKGKILKIILEEFKITPSKIIFIDDKIDNIYSLQDFCKDKKIAFSGFHYIAKNDILNIEGNSEIEEKRFQILLKNNVWLN